MFGFHLRRALSTEQHRFIRKSESSREMPPKAHVYDKGGSPRTLSDRKTGQYGIPQIKFPSNFSRAGSRESGLCARYCSELDKRA